MTVGTTEITAGPYLGNALTDTFDYGFRITDKSQLSVYLTNTTNITALLTVDVDYTVTGIGNDGGGTIILLSGPLITGYVLYIRSNYQVTQLTAFQSQGAFFPGLHEDAMDKLTFLIQQLEDSIDRCPSLLESYSGTLPLTIESPVAGEILRWKGDLSGLESFNFVSSSLVASGELVIYPSVAAMKADTSGVLVPGINTMTQGYHSSDDGGAGFYVIKGSQTVDDFGDHTLDNGNVAILTKKGNFNINQYGAKGDFDPSTGIGNDDRPSTKAAIDAAIANGGGTVTANSGGHYYMGADYSVPLLGVQIIIGDQAANDSAIGIHLRTQGAKFYQGAEGKCFLFANGVHCSWYGPHVIGYTGGTLGPSRENDACIMINKKCRHIEIKHHYLTNSLGDALIVQAAVDEAGGGLGNECRDINIHSGVLKERFGDNIPSYLGGTKSREATAIIVGIDVNLHNNVIFGSVDIEPNLDGQVIQDVVVQSNIFSSGRVSAQTVIGTDYWHDEPLTLSGLGAVLNNDIKLQGVAGAPIISGVKCTGNIIDNGQISGFRTYVWDDISNNSFRTGSIVLASDNAVSYATGFNVHGNTCIDVIAGRTGFIEINGQITDSNISDNFLKNGVGSCVHVGTHSIGPVFDLNNVFSNNKALTGGTDYSGLLQNSSIIKGITPYANSHFSTQLIITGFTGTGNIIDFSLNRADCWYIQQATGVATSLADVSNSYGDGQLIEIMAEAAGGGSLTVIHSASMVLKGAVNAVLNNTNLIAIRRNFGRWVEVYRNF